MKIAEEFDNKLVQYGMILREYDEVEALCIADDWKNRKLINRLEEIERRRDNIIGPLNTILKRLARIVVK
jgi:hypothetical protein